MAGPLLEGDTLLVTGAANGIGRAVAAEAAREGCRVALSDLDGARCEEAAAAIREDGGAATVLPADLSQDGAAEALFDAAAAALGRVSIVVHAASPKRLESDTLFRVSDADYERMLTVNLRSGFKLMRRAARHMLDGSIRGRLMFVTSLHAGSPRNLPHYSASKAAMHMTMMEFARALGPKGIRVNALVPGAIAAGGFVPDATLAKKIPMGRLGEGREVAAMAIAVLSDRFGSYVHGSAVTVDGGISLTNWFDAPAL